MSCLKENYSRFMTINSMGSLLLWAFLGRFESQFSLLFDQTNIFDSHKLSEVCLWNSRI